MFDSETHLLGLFRFESNRYRVMGDHTQDRMIQGNEKWQVKRQRHCRRRA